MEYVLSQKQLFNNDEIFPVPYKPFQIYNVAVITCICSKMVLLLVKLSLEFNRTFEMLNVAKSTTSDILHGTCR
jgi:hypothetical protein